MRSNLDELADKDLMRQVLRKDHEAFSALVHRHTKIFYAAAYRICSHQNDAEDIVQDAFLKLWRNPKIWNEKKNAKFTTWFYRIVVNQAIDHMRKTKSVNYGDNIEIIADDAAGQQQVMEEKDRSFMLENAIRKLPERQKIALNLCVYEDLSNKQAAEIMGVSVKALESLIMRAKSGLRFEFLRIGLLSFDDEVNKEASNG